MKGNTNKGYQPNTQDDHEEFEEKTGVYDAKFLGTGRCVLKENDLDNRPVEEQSGSVQETSEQTGEQLLDAMNFTYVLPTRFERGDSMETYLVQNMPVSIALLSNATFKDLSPKQQAVLGIASARFCDERIDLTTLNFDLKTHADRVSLPDLLLKDRQNRLLPLEREQANRLLAKLKVTICPKKKTFDAEASGECSPCFLIRNRNLYEISHLGHQTLQSGDVVLIVTKGVLKALVSHVTKKAYAGAVPALSAPNEDLALASIPREFEEQEIANQILGLVEVSKYDTNRLNTTGDAQERQLNPQKLFNLLTQIYHKEQRGEPETKVITDAFALYQVP